MALTAREIVFYIRAENQASSAIRRAAKDIGGLRNLKGIQAGAARQVAAAEEAVNVKLLQQRRNIVAIEEAQVRLNKMQLAAARMGGAALANQNRLIDAQAERIAILTEEEGLYIKRVEAATAALERQKLEAEQLSNAIPVERMGRLVQVISRAGHLLRVGGLIAGVAVGASAIAAARFRSESTLAATQMRKPGQGFGVTNANSMKISDQVLKLMQQFPASAADMNDSFYQIFSGTNVQNIGKATNMLKVFNEMAVAGGTDLKTMTDAGISMYNNFPKEFKNMKDAANAFFSVVRYGRMNAEQFATSLTRVLPIAKAAGLSFSDVGNAMAFVTRQTGGKRTGLDATGLGRLIEMLGNPETVAGLKKYGINVKDATHKMRPLVDIISEMHDKLVASGKFKPGPDLLNLIKELTAGASKSGHGGTAGTMQGRRILDYLLTDTAAYLQVAGQVTRDNKEMEQSFQAMNKSPGVQWSRFTNQIKALVYEIGTAAIPAFMELGRPIEKVLKHFNNMSTHTKHLIGEILVFGSVAAVAAGILLGFVSVLGRIFVMYRILRMTGGIGAALGFGAEGGFATAKFGIVIAAVTALAVVLYEYPGVLHHITQAMGGLHGVMTAVSILLGGAMLASMVKFAGETEIAGVAVAGLRSKLLLLAAIGAITIPIFLRISKDAGQAHGHDLRTYQHPGGLSGLWDKAVYGTEYGVARAIGWSPSQSRDAARSIAGFVAGGMTKMKTIPVYYQRLIGNLIDNGQVSNAALETAQWLVWNGKYSDFMKIYRHYFPLAAKRAIGGTDVNPRQTSIAAQAASAITVQHHTVLTKSFMQRLQAVAVLYENYQRHGTLANARKYYDALAALNKDYSSTLYKQYISDYLSKVDAANTAAKNKTKKDNSAYLSQLQSMYSNINTMYQNFLQQQQGIYGSLFQGPYMQSAGAQAFLSFNNQQPTPAMVLKDVKSQLFQGNRFNSIMNQLRGKGAPKGLIDQLMAAGTSALPFIKAVNHLSPSQLKEYEDNWNRMQTAIKTNTMRQLNGQLKIYEHFGKKVAQAIIAGISSEDPKLQDKLESIINNMFPELVKKAGKAPVTVPRGHKTTVHPVTHVTHQHFSPHITTTKTENVNTALKKSYFHMKQHTWY